ncbi:MAG TPA: nitroreductase family protein [Alphaproteobacteria bacterium]|nr:nitroreductase family protein [Alphaproteobacteria bacterium]
MATLDLTPDELLSTTRAVRKRLDFDRPVELSVIRECVDLALQAPSGSNAQGWHFVVVTDEAKRNTIGELYRKGFELYRGMEVSAHALARAQEDPADAKQMERVVDSAEYLAANMHRAPALVIPCITGRVEHVPGDFAVIAQASTYGSILPAFWSFMLAARARGLGTSWTTIHLMFERQVADLLGIPYDEITQVALSPLAYTKGTDFKPARRKPIDDVLHVDAW